MATKKPPTPTKTPGRRGSAPGEHRGGRKKGTPNKKTVIKRQLEAVKASAAPGDLLTPLQFMLSVVNNKKMPMRFRGDMAKNAAPYVHPKLVAITAKTTNKNLNVDASALIEEGQVDPAALYRDIMGADEDEEAED